MVILQYIQSIDFRLGGPPRAVVELTGVLAGRGHEVILATTNDRDVPEDWRHPPGPELICVPPVAGAFKRLTQAGVQSLRDAIAQSAVVHLHGVWEPANQQVAAVCRSLGTPYVVSLRGMLDDWSMRQHSIRKRLYLALVGRRYLERAAAVHCTAEAELRQSHKWFSKGRGAVVPNLMDLRPYTQLPNPEPALTHWPELRRASFTVLFLSRIHEKKGVEHLLEAASRVVPKVPGIRLVIAGGGEPAYLANLRMLAASLGIADHTSWVGSVDGSLKRSLYAAADLMAVPTSQENFGFVFFECLASGTPVVTTDLVDTSAELGRSGGARIIPQTPEAFASEIEAFATGRRDARAMGAAGRAWTLAELATDRVASDFESLYHSCALHPQKCGHSKG
jgi:glycosyltransferase involved in cell wall biosynthesis